MTDDRRVEPWREPVEAEVRLVVMGGPNCPRPITLGELRRCLAAQDPPMRVVSRDHDRCIVHHHLAERSQLNDRIADLEAQVKRLTGELSEARAYGESRHQAYEDEPAPEE